MASNDYHFITHWQVRGDIAEIYDVITKPDLPRWWPSVYQRVDELEPGDADGLGRVFDLYTKGWLPYTLRWRFKIVELKPPYRLALRAQGDFVGRGIWTFQQTGAWVDITYDWRIKANKPLLRYLSFAMKPVFAANHRWAMARGEESLLLELQRLRAKSPAERALVPPPPGPTPDPAELIGKLIASLKQAANSRAYSLRDRSSEESKE